MTATEAVDVLERHGVKVALSGNGLDFVKAVAQVIVRLEQAVVDAKAVPF